MNERIKYLTMDMSVYQLTDVLSETPLVYFSDKNQEKAIQVMDYTCERLHQEKKAFIAEVDMFELNESLITYDIENRYIELLKILIEQFQLFASSASLKLPPARLIDNANTITMYIDWLLNRFERSKVQVYFYLKHFEFYNFFFDSFSSLMYLFEMNCGKLFVSNIMLDTIQRSYGNGSYVYESLALKIPHAHFVNSGDSCYYDIKEAQNATRSKQLK